MNKFKIYDRVQYKAYRPTEELVTGTIVGDLEYSMGTWNPLYIVICDTAFINHNSQKPQKAELVSEPALEPIKE